MRTFVIVALVAVVAAGASARTDIEHDSPVLPADKELITDGSFVHDAGELLLHVTNWGLIGSHYSQNTTYSDAPSAMWPAWSGHNYLWGAGLWVGAVKLGEVSVSTGQYETEILALPGPEHVIYATDWLAAGSARYPFADPDDDGDGAENEDPLNGLDDDLDGLIDEDGAGISEQMFRAEMYDNTALGQEIFPDHRPLDLKIVQTSLQWSQPVIDDLVGFQYDITNVGDTTLDDVYVGLFSDFDIAALGQPGGAVDDLVGYRDEVVEAYPGQDVRVQVAFARDQNTAAFGYIGWVLLDHPVDPDGVAAPSEVGVRTFQRYSGQAPYHQGGDPTNDAQRYETMAMTDLDPDAPSPDDWRLLTSCGPFATLDPGQTITVAYALVAGMDEEDLLRGAARARLLHDGMAFDRDGDPANGEEFVVHWLGPEEIAVSIEDAGDEIETPAAAALALDAAPNPFNPALEISGRLPQAGHARLTVLDARGRRVATLHDGHVAVGEARWTWEGRDDRGQQVASGVYMLVLETEARVLRRAVTLVK